MSAAPKISHAAMNAASPLPPGAQQASKKKAKFYVASPTLRRFHNDNTRVRAVMGSVGCLSAYHEIMTRTGWVRIDQWNGEEILVARPDGTTWFEQPEQYIVAPCDWFYHLRARGVDQVLSPEHRVLHFKKFNRDVPRVITAEELVRSHTKLASGWDGLIPTEFSAPDNAAGVAYTDDEVKLIVALSADGHYVERAVSRPWTMCLAKQRKKDRLRQLLSAAGIAWRERVYRGRPDHTYFDFQFGRGTKDLTVFWQANAHQLRLIVDEAMWWDGHVDKHEAWIYYTTVPEHRDFMQYAMSAQGRRTSISFETNKQAEHHATLYRVVGNKTPRAGIRYDGKKAAIRKVRSPDGNKYCFTTSTGYFITRHHDCVAITGNSGKSVGMCMEILQRAKSQAAFNGVRSSRWAVIRSSYRELKTTTIATFRQWLGHLGTFTWDSPITFRTNNLPLPDGTKLNLEVLFFPVASPEDVESLKSLELTGAWINEATGVPEACLQVLKTRLDRFPSDIDGGPSWSGIIMDTNPPNTRHWFHELFEKTRPKGHQLYRQPPPLLRNDDGTYSPNPHAENVENITAGYDYYFNQIAGASEEFVRVFVMGEYGSIHDGKPVFDKFSDRRHISHEPLQPYWHNPIIIGMDFGLTPAAALMQMAPTGQLLILDEIATHDTGFNEFLDDELMPLLNDRYRGHSVFIVGDPAAEARTPIAQGTVFTLMRQRGLACDAAITNDITTRIDAVNYFLSRSDAMLIDRRCQNVIDGFSGGYKFAHGKHGEFKPRPDKGVWLSHIMDAVQYGCLHYYRDVIQVPTKSQVSVSRRSGSGPKPKRSFFYA